MKARDIDMKSYIIWSLIVSGIMFLGIPLVVLLFGPKDASFPLQILSISLQGIFITAILSAGIANALRELHYGEACVLGIILLI